MRKTHILFNSVAIFMCVSCNKIHFFFCSLPLFSLILFTFVALPEFHTSRRLIELRPSTQTLQLKIYFYMLMVVVVIFYFFCCHFSQFFSVLYSQLPWSLRVSSYGVKEIERKREPKKICNIMLEKGVFFYSIFIHPIQLQLEWIGRKKKTESAQPVFEI